ncbi:xanthine dehydrogenase small subunit [Aeoliella sp. SH292]|uniref:xanthine dehydrogenase small subunit n=1 Tax=Aeoliella sp. SH292 TaxID=3454464 RepID=UPI003F97DB74
MRDHVVFYVNGVRRTADAATALRTLSDYLRLALGEEDSTRLTGTKIACAEGDCGACTVLVGELAANGHELVYRTIDACIAFVFQMDGRHVVTVEGLGGTPELTAIQSAMVDGHGSQCGFCTPGFVMALHGVAEEHAAEGATGCFHSEQLRSGLSGNLCRCTGYQQILDAAQSIAPEAIERLGSRYGSKALIDALKALASDAVEIAPNHVANGSPAPVVAIPKSIDDLLAGRSKFPEARLVAGATDLGVHYNHGKFTPQQVIYTGAIDELREVRVEDNQLVIGATARWSDILPVVREHAPQYAEVLERFGSPQIRHAGTLAGNLMNASPIADSIPFHLVCESTLKLSSARRERVVAISDFYLGYKELDLKSGEVLVSIDTPLPPADVELRLYKVSKRRDMDISTVTAAFWVRESNGKVVEARIAAGGVGPVVVRLGDAEQSLVGRALTLESMREAGRIARTEIKPISDVRGAADYRLQLVENLFSKCFHDLQVELQGSGA